MNFQDLESVFGKVKSAFDRYQIVKVEVAKIQEELGAFIHGTHSWKDRDSVLPKTGEKVLTSELIGGQEKYNVVFFESKDQLYKYWIKLDQLPTS